MDDKSYVGTAIIRSDQEDQADLVVSGEAPQIPLWSLLLATVLSGSLWWGIVVGIRSMFPVI